MKEEVRRILKMVQDGKISAEDAMELIEAFDEKGTGSGESTNSADASGAGAQDAGQTPPPPPPPPPGDHCYTDPLKSFLDGVDRIARQANDQINWQDIGKQVRDSTRKGIDLLTNAVEDLTKNGINFFGNVETVDIVLPIPSIEGKTLRIEQSHGNIVAKNGFSESKIKATARIRAATHEEAKARAAGFTIALEENDHEVIVKLSATVGLSCDFDIELANNIGVEFRTESGDVTIDGITRHSKVSSRNGFVTARKCEGLLDLESSNGDIEVQDSTVSSVAIRTSSGDVTLERVKGNTSIKANSGDIVLANCSGRTISVDAVSGNCVLDLSEPIEGVISVSTLSGNGVVSIPDGSNCRVKLSAARGTVTSRVELENRQESTGLISGTLGKGEGSLDVSAVNGNIELSLRDHGTH